MAIVNSNDELLKQPSCCTLLEGTLVIHAMSLNIIHKIAPWGKLTDNSQVFRGEEHLVQLYDVRVHTTQPLVQDFLASCLDAAGSAVVSEVGVHK